MFCIFTSIFLYRKVLLEIDLTYFAKALVQKGHTVTIVCGSYQAAITGLDSLFNKGVRRGTIDGINIIEFDLSYANKDTLLKRSLIFLNYVRKSLRLIYSEPYDLIFATSTPLTAGIPGVISRIFKRKPFVFEVRDLWPELPRAVGVIKNPVILGILSLLEWCSYRASNRLIGLSPGIIEGIARRSQKNKPIAFIPNGCDFNIFDQEAKPWRPAEIKEKDFLALYAGTHGISNGLSVVLDVALVLKKRSRNDIKILFVGEGMEKQALKLRAKNEELDNIIFHDSVSKLKLVGLMKSSNIGLQLLKNIPAFYHGTSPNKFFDYISAGLPVLNNYPGWLAGLIAEYQCGYVVPPDNVAAFADALENAADHGQLDQMGANGLRLAHENFNRTVLAQDFVGFLEGALK